MHFYCCMLYTLSDSYNIIMTVIKHYYHYNLLHSNSVNTDTIATIEGFHINKVS